MPSTPKTARMYATRHVKTPGSGQIAQPPYHPKPKPYRPSPHLRAAEIDALPRAVSMGRVANDRS
ncbi:hypothetical protein [Candidimonas nitroreducens]|uniref:Uncharacterized protein n=1 Tax=Candidimonas nitroreducens TaxID=683354 RepID=A0A225MKV9_9BURK|nr:hypothetical protein [Candidimonas nitroreducens]OWT62007.1 hypothetical protein CEY11_09380 [Candidimonas nitroreducens]